MLLQLALLHSFYGLPWWLRQKESACNAGDLGSVPELRGSLGGGHGNPLQYSCLENLTDRGAWWAMVHRVTKSWTWLKWLSRHACTECSSPCFPVLQYLPEFAQTHVQLVGDAIQPSHHLLLPSPFCLQSFPASGPFPMSWLLFSSGHSIGASASASILPMNTQGWFPLGLRVRLLE